MTSAATMPCTHAARMLGRWVAAGALEQHDVEDALYGSAERNGLVADDGARQCWATIRTGLSAGLQPNHAVGGDVIGPDDPQLST